MATSAKPSTWFPLGELEGQEPLPLSFFNFFKFSKTKSSFFNFLKSLDPIHGRIYRGAPVPSGPLSDSFCMATSDKPSTWFSLGKLESAIIFQKILKFKKIIIFGILGKV